MKKRTQPPELPEDMEVVGPGQMLADARGACKLTQQEVADKLNFRVALVRDIEADRFDKSMPATYNRGYLRNYAKLVNIPVDDVLASYEMLEVAATQGAEMQSFSKITEKQAQNKRLMWSSYLILAALIASTVVWWLQDIKSADVATSVSEPIKADEDTSSSSETVDENVDENLLSDTPLPTEAELVEAPASIASTSVESTQVSTEDNDSKTVNAVFRFSGDCWVNIYDASGERIAWGVKKSGYVMTISGLAPLKVTLGKPERVAISLDGQDIDMSAFNVGNIAKFSLPITP
ncbi:RodZ domain-containing protein [Colwelliaceae bacterium 6471]